MKTAFAFAILTAACVHAPAIGDSFTPGHIFISESGGEGCLQEPHPLNWVREIDPRTGESWYFADYTDKLCGPNALRFTPDGKRLRVANETGNTVMDFDPAGEGALIYDRDEGLAGPAGENGLVFDRLGRVNAIPG